MLHQSFDMVPVNPVAVIVPVLQHLDDSLILSSRSRSGHGLMKVGQLVLFINLAHETEG